MSVRRVFLGRFSVEGSACCRSAYGPHQPFPYLSRRRADSMRLKKALAIAFVPLASACAPHHEPVDTRPRATPTPFDAGPDSGGIIVSESDAGDGGCSVTEIFDPAPSANHVPVGTALSYATMPPVGGDHYPFWANFENYAEPLDHGYLVHALEHGAVVFWYRCANREACPTLASELESLAASIVPDDPLCAPYPTVRRRMIVVPEPKLTSVVAAASWAHAIALGCVDRDRLRAFTLARYDRATESVCAPGIVPPPR